MKPVSHSRLFRRATLALALSLAFGLGGCVTVPDSETRDTGPDPLTRSRYEVVGHIAFVDAERDIAVVNLESHVRDVSGELKARNDILVETAVLEPTSQRSGRSLGVRILSGLPNTGDEVVVARD